MTVQKYENFLLIDGVTCGHGVETARSVRDGVEEQFGFDFKRGLPIERAEMFAGYSYDGPINFDLPEGWTEQPTSVQGYVRLDDEKGRFRGYIDYYGGKISNINLRLWPRFKYDIDIIFSHKHEEELGHGMRRVWSDNYWITSVQAGLDEHVLPAFIHYGEFPNYCDFDRLNKELKAIHNAQDFMARQVAEFLPGARLERTWEHATLSDGFAEMSMGGSKDGDLFAYWNDEADVQNRLSGLSKVLKAELPKILGEDNSLVLCMFPAEEEIAKYKKDVPNYTAPEPNFWQRQRYRLHDLLNSREP